MTDLKPSFCQPRCQKVTYYPLIIAQMKVYPATLFKFPTISLFFTALKLKLRVSKKCRMQNIKLSIN